MSKIQYDPAITAINQANTILVIQGENPDGDSLGSSLALEEILSDLGKTVVLYCPINIPSYLHYVRGWDRVLEDFPRNFDLSIIVDTTSETLLERAIIPENVAHITAHPCVVLDHHATESTLPFATTLISDPTCVATGELIYNLSKVAKWDIHAQAAEHLVISIMADSLGLTTPGTTAASIHAIADLVELGASIPEIEVRRRELMKKSPEILAYKGRLLERIEYFADGQLALVHVPWEEIAKYSHSYNPSILVIEEMRLVEHVRVAIVTKTYPDGKITGKIRCNPDAKVAETIAKSFGGGGHPYVAGFRTYSDSYENVKTELITTVNKILKEYDIETQKTEL